tara:strand:- start:2479 stop:3075 length:597 start_codon:yes stop_codon:yes gene_type:complete
MKLTPKLLKRLIRETIRENSMLLSESIGKDYQSLMDSLEFKNNSLRTFGIMSGQNPMAQDTLSAEENEQKVAELNAALDSLFGPEGHVPIGGKYGNPEKSNVIEDPSQEDMEKLCEQFQQESYVWGNVAEEPPYKLMKVEYDENGKALGSFLYPDSTGVDIILKDDIMSGADDNYSELEGKKFGFPFFGMPESSDDEV